jgi:hypothetical protein
MIYIADVFMWCWCWLAYQLVIILPSHQRWVEPVWKWLLPFAGYYGYHDPEIHTWRWSGRVRP